VFGEERDGFVEIGDRRGELPFLASSQPLVERLLLREAWIAAIEEDGALFLFGGPNVSANGSSDGLIFEDDLQRFSEKLHASFGKRHDALPAITKQVGSLTNEIELDESRKRLRNRGDVEPEHSPNPRLGNGDAPIRMARAVSFVDDIENVEARRRHQLHRLSTPIHDGAKRLKDLATKPNAAEVRPLKLKSHGMHDARD
jgi:hypothetical protein